MGYGCPDAKASITSQKQMLTMLLGAGPSVDQDSALVLSVDALGGLPSGLKTALHVAVYMQYEIGCRLLLDRGTDLTLPVYDTLFDRFIDGDHLCISKQPCNASIRVLLKEARRRHLPAAQNQTRAVPPPPTDPSAPQGPSGPNGSSGNNAGSQGSVATHQPSQKSGSQYDRSQYRKAIKAIQKGDVKTVKTMIDGGLFDFWHQLGRPDPVCRAIISFKTIVT